jgi:hypothetical protein
VANPTHVHTDEAELRCEALDTSHLIVQAKEVDDVLPVRGQLQVVPMLDPGASAAVALFQPIAHERHAADDGWQLLPQGVDEAVVVVATGLAKHEPSAIHLDFHRLALPPTRPALVALHHFSIACDADGGLLHVGDAVSEPRIEVAWRPLDVTARAAEVGARSVVVPHGVAAAAELRRGRGSGHRR